MLETGEWAVNADRIIAISFCPVGRWWSPLRDFVLLTTESNVRFSGPVGFNDLWNGRFVPKTLKIIIIQLSCINF